MPSLFIPVQLALVRLRSDALFAIQEVSVVWNVSLERGFRKSRSAPRPASRREPGDRNNRRAVATADQAGLGPPSSVAAVCRCGVFAFLNLYVTQPLLPLFTRIF